MEEKLSGENFLLYLGFGGIPTANLYIQGIGWREFLLSEFGINIFKDYGEYGAFADRSLWFQPNFWSLRTHSNEFCDLLQRVQLVLLEQLGLVVEFISGQINYGSSDRPYHPEIPNSLLIIGRRGQLQNFLSIFDNQITRLGDTLIKKMRPGEYPLLLCSGYQNTYGGNSGPHNEPLCIFFSYETREISYQSDGEYEGPGFD